MLYSYVLVQIMSGGERSWTELTGQIAREMPTLNVFAHVVGVLAGIVASHTHPDLLPNIGQGRGHKTPDLAV